MNDPLERTELEDRIKASLEQSVRSLDEDTQQRLNAIRRAALNQPSKASWFKLNGWLPATSLAFCSVIALLVILPSHQSKQTSDLSDQTAMLELLDNTDELDVISDPYFYMWLDEIKSENGTHHAV